MQNIQYVTDYNTEMRKSLADKAFFMDVIDADVYVDFGCADGTLLGYIKEQKPNAICIGYDISDQEIAIAKQNYNFQFFSNWNSMIARLEKFKNKKIAIICNSVIHEVYAYGNKQSVDEFWHRLSNPVFNYVVIRDMALKTFDGNADKKDVRKLRRHADTAQLRDFENNWGDINEHKSFVHYLLKYRYKKNWAREVKEDYLPITLAEMIGRLNGTITHFDHYTLPFIKQTIKKDFNIDFDIETHVKIIMVS